MPIETPELKRFVLLDLIGCGGMGYVYNGYEPKSQTPVAVKILSPECVAMPVVLDRFKIEGKILKSLNHPNIVKYVDAGEDGAWHFLAMEFVKGMSMDSLPMSHSASSLGVLQTVPSMEEYVGIFRECFEGLAYIHKQDLVHRDIKPQNIILSGSSFKPIFIDFGIAKNVREINDLEDTEERLYTVVYASPEQLTSKPIDLPSDLFSFGVVMYEKLTGRLPFDGRSEMAVSLAQIKWNFPPPRQLNPAIPQKLEQVILRLLARDPEQRYPSAQMVAGELEKLHEVLKAGAQGLAMSGILNDIREMPHPDGVARRTLKRRSLSDEMTAMKKARNEFVEAKNQLRIATSRLRTEPDKIDQLRAISEQFRLEYEKLQQITKMSLGFRSQPLVIDTFNSIHKMDILAYEKRGVPFTINKIEQKLAHSDGSDIVVGTINFTERVKRLYSLNHKDSFLSWDESYWFFNAYEEKDFPIYFMVGAKGSYQPPRGFKGFFWPLEFVVALHKLGQTGISIVESIAGVDRNGQAGFSTHRETILFSQNMFDAFKKQGPAIPIVPEAKPLR
jgi:serine/threonine protein kinase